MITPSQRHFTGGLLQSMERAFLGGSAKSFQSIFPSVSEQRQGKDKAGHQPLLTRGMNVRAQIDLIDYQSMPDGSYHYELVYQDNSA